MEKRSRNTLIIIIIIIKSRGRVAVIHVTYCMSADRSS